jgi:hypothetical protein
MRAADSSAPETAASLVHHLPISNFLAAAHRLAVRAEHSPLDSECQGREPRNGAVAWDTSVFHGTYRG